MRCMRSSICRCRSKTVSGRTSVTVRRSAPTAWTTVSVADTREDVLEAEEGLEPGGALEAPSVDRAGILEEVHGAGRRVVEPEAEELAEDGARDRLRDGDRRAARLADRQLQRHRSGADHVEHPVRAGLERERDGLRHVLLVDELHHRVEAEDRRHVALPDVAPDRALYVVAERVHRPQDG